ncbi:hypothetical protein MCP1_730010 [Candidatus Terasakiella magnetica]|nr:hypothetical protein MCP1_730010 [Candidatus Terasakiella magnetica]
MAFEGLFFAMVEDGGVIELPQAWIPDDGAFCAFIPSRARPPCVAVHPFAMADMMRQSLPEANRLSGSSMDMNRLAVECGRLILPAALRSAIGLHFHAGLVGKGGHFLVIDRVPIRTSPFCSPQYPGNRGQNSQERMGCNHGKCRLRCFVECC